MRILGVMPSHRPTRSAGGRDRGPLAAAARFAMSVPGQILLNTAAFRLPEELFIRPHWRVLDVRCRRAGLVRVLATRAKLEQAPVGLDASPELLAAARHDIAIEGGPAVSLTRGVAHALPYADESFDLIVAGHAFKYFADDELRACLAEGRRALKEGGIFLAWEYAPSRSAPLDRWNRWVLTRNGPFVRLRSFQEMRALALEAGYDMVRRARLRPFLFPPIPRVSLLMVRAPEAWRRAAVEAGGAPDGETGSSLR